MSLSATITLDRSQTTRTQKVRATVVVSNSGATNPVTVLNIVPQIQSSFNTLPNSVSDAAGQCISNQAVPPLGSATFVFDMNFHTANPKTTYDSPAPQHTYNVGCFIYGDDGSITSPTPATITLIPEKNYGSF